MNIVAKIIIIIAETLLNINFFKSFWYCLREQLWF